MLEKQHTHNQLWDANQQHILILIVLLAYLFPVELLVVLDEDVLILLYELVSHRRK